MKIPSLLQAYGAIQSRLEPRLHEVINTRGFAQAVAVVSAIQSSIGRSMDEINERVLHTFNLPAGTDVQKLHRQIGELDHEIRTLRLEISRLTEDRDR